MIKSTGCDLKKIEIAIKSLRGFAKAFWSKRPIWECTDCGEIEFIEREIICWHCHMGEMVFLGIEWQYYLQQMILTDEPLKYLEQFKTDK